MAYDPTFGHISEREGDRPAAPAHFRAALMGDFTGRANRGDATPLGDRKPVKVDYDTQEDVLRKLEVRLRIPVGGGASFVDLAFEELEDFHPDRLFDKVELIDEVLGLARRVDRKPDKAIPLIVGWGAGAGDPCAPATAGGASVPVAASCAEMADCSAGPTVAEDATQLDGNDLFAKLVGPYVKALDGAEPDAAAVKDAIQQASNGLLREIMHHPDFRAVESAWRGLDWLLRRTAKGDRARVVLFDVAAAELAADLAGCDDLEESGVFELLAKKTSEGVDGDPWCTVVGLYTFDLVGSHAELLGRMGQICHRLHAPFLTGIGRRLLVEKAKLADEDQAAWDAMRALPAAGYIGLAGPGFLLRRPYGENGDEPEQLAFEELESGADTDGYLWANAALAGAALLALELVDARGWNFHPGKSLRLGKMKMHTYRDEDGEGVAVLVEKRVSATVGGNFASFGTMPLFAERGADVIVFGAVQSASSKEKALLGPWGAEGGSAPPLFDAADAPGVQVGVGPGDVAGADDAGTGTGGGAAGPAVADDDDDDDDDDLSSLLGDDDDGGDDLSSLLGGDDDDDDDDLSSLLGGDDDDDDADLDSLLADDDDDEGDLDLDALLADDDDDDDMDADLAELLKD
jgi:hypothetical protein